jgi:hypothetical protein
VSHGSALWTRWVSVTGIFLYLAIAFAVAKMGLEAALQVLGRVGPHCPMFAFTGLKCGFCGMSRAFIHLFAGETGEAFRLNVLSVPMFVGVLVACFVGWCRNPASIRLNPVLVGAACCVLFAYALARNLVPGVP